MFIVLLTFTVILSVQCIKASEKFPEVNPELGPWQNLHQVFPLTDTWYVVYRNYKDDPAFGSAKCLMFKETSAETENDHRLTSSYVGLDEPINILLSTGASEGYSVNNRLKAVPENGGDAAEYHVIYGDTECSLTRNTYVSDDAMMVLMNKAHLDKYGPSGTCCDFLYAMLSGSSRKYKIYDDRCQTSE